MFCCRVVRVDAEQRGRSRHQLPESDCAGARKSVGVPARFDRNDGHEHIGIEAPAYGVEEHAARQIPALPARHLRVDVAQNPGVHGDGDRRGGYRSIGRLRWKQQRSNRKADRSQEAQDGPSHMGPVGSRRALAVLLFLFIVMCGLIAWSQWYAIHVNVPRYQAQHRAAPAH